MIYLFSQIAISLVLAAIVGGAVGWLVHRARAAKQIHQLQQVVARQQQQVNEAQGEVSILSADFDDLKQRTDTEINSLSQENKEIPALNQNLEKSQLLVRQMIEQHKSELDEAHVETEQLLLKAKQADDREKEITKLQAELDIERRKSTRTQTNNAEESAKEPIDITALSQASNPTSDNKTNSGDSSSASDNNTNSDTSAYSGDNSRSSLSEKTATVKLPLSGNSFRSSSISTTTTNSNTTSSSTNSAIESTGSNDDTLPNAAQTAAELNALRDQLAEDIPSSTKNLSNNDNFVEVTPSSSFATSHNLAETEVDEANLEQMFDTVDQHDDLKQIFGIGPVTEKTLNKLGITAYAQLAELKQHDIEKIADALQIFPGRIERDNWVGGARLQLEEVLEDL